jgi:SH3 domain-containing YSC84-like protein 1
MKKFLLLGFAAIALIAAPFSRADQRSDQIRHVETCEAILQEFMDDPAYAIPTPVLQHARGIVVVNQFKAGFLFGLTGGYGVVMAKRADDSWSIPVLITAGEMSFGLQAGGKSIETIFIINDDETIRRIFPGRMNVGVDAKAVVGPKWTEVETVNKEILATPVLVYTKSKGLFAGATVKTGFLTRDDDANRVLYRTSFTMPELLYGNFVTPPDAVKPIMNYVTKISQGQ